MSELTKKSGIAWIGNLPESWDVAILKRTTYLKGRIGWQGLTTDEYRQDGDYLLVTGTDFDYGQIEWSRCAYVDKERYEEDPYIQLRENDLLITKDGTIGKVAIVRGLPKPATLNSGVFVTRPLGNHYRQDFLYWVLVSDIFPEFIRYSMVGTTINHLYQKTFERFAYPLPPLPEQERIAAYLDASCAAIDAAVTAKRRQLETLDALRRAILHSIFAHDEWPFERIKDVATKIGSGVTPEGGASNYLDDGIPLLRSQNVHFDGLRLDDVAFISEDTHAEMAGSQLKPRDVLLNITGASIGRCTFVPDDFGGGNVNQHVCIIRSNHRIDHRFLSAFLSSPMGQGQILSSFTGASRQGLSQKELGLIAIPLPSIKVQCDAMTVLDQQKLHQQRMRTNIESQIDTLIAYRKSLIHECVTGQRRVMDEAFRQMQQQWLRY